MKLLGSFVFGVGVGTPDFPAALPFVTFAPELLRMVVHYAP